MRRRAEDGEVDYAEAAMGCVTFTPEFIPVLADSPFDLEATVEGVTYRGDAAGVSQSPGATSTGNRITSRHVRR